MSLARLFRSPWWTPIFLAVIAWTTADGLTRPGSTFVHVLQVVTLGLLAILAVLLARDTLRRWKKARQCPMCNGDGKRRDSMAHLVTGDGPCQWCGGSGRRKDYEARGRDSRNPGQASS